MEGYLPQVESRLLKIGPISGTDSDDRLYDNLHDMWSFELQPNSVKRRKKKSDGTKSSWYSKAYDYWEDEKNCPLSDDGVLGGFGAVTPVDIKESNEFLDKILEMRPNLRLNRVADCGAGIGRVSKNFLLHRCSHVDLVEQSPRLLEASANYIGEDSSRTTCICTSLQEFKPEPNTYDMIWIQWVVGHLHDADFVAFFRNCIQGLTEHGVVVLKDNTVEDWTFVVDKADSSITRCSNYSRILFDMAEVDVLLEEKQKDFPSELNPINMFALAERKLPSNVK